MNDDVRNKVIKKMTTERDLRNQMEYTLQKAIAEGHSEGIRLAVRKMLDSGMTAEQVSAIMDIPLSEITAM